MLDQEQHIGDVLGIEPFQLADHKVGGRRGFDREPHAAKDRVVGPVRIWAREDQRLFGHEVILFREVLIRWVEAKVCHRTSPAQICFHEARSREDVDVEGYTLLQPVGERS